MPEIVKGTFSTGKGPKADNEYLKGADLVVSGKRKVPEENCESLAWIISPA